MRTLLRGFPTAGDGDETPPCVPDNKTASIALHQRSQQHILKGEQTIASAKKKTNINQEFDLYGVSLGYFPVFVHEGL